MVIINLIAAIIAGAITSYLAGDHPLSSALAFMTFLGMFGYCTIIDYFQGIAKNQVRIGGLIKKG